MGGARVWEEPLPGRSPCLEGASAWEEPLRGRSLCLGGAAWEEPVVTQPLSGTGLHGFLHDNGQRVRPGTVSLSQRRGHTCFPLDSWRRVGDLVGRNRKGPSLKKDLRAFSC